MTRNPNSGVLFSFSVCVCGGGGGGGGGASGGVLLGAWE